MPLLRKRRHAKSKTSFKVVQGKGAEKHHWYFEKNNATSEDYTAILSSVFQPSNEPKPHFNYGVIAFRFEAEKKGEQYKVSAAIRGFVQLISPTKCTKAAFLEMIDVDVDAFEPSDVIYDYPEENIQADSFRLLVLAGNKGSVEGGTLRRRGPPRMQSERDGMEDSTYGVTRRSGNDHVNVTQELLTDNWDDFYTTHPTSSSQINHSRSKRTIYPVDRYVPELASPSVGILENSGRDSSSRKGDEVARGRRSSLEELSGDTSPDEEEEEEVPKKKSMKKSGDYCTGRVKPTTHEGVAVVSNEEHRSRNIEPQGGGNVNNQEDAEMATTEMDINDDMVRNFLKTLTNDQLKSYLNEHSDSNPSGSKRSSDGDNEDVA